MGGQGVGPGAGAVVRYLAGMWVVAAVTILIRTHCKQSSLTSIQLTGTCRCTGNCALGYTQV